MRWDGQGIGVDDGALPGLQRLGFVRSVRSPQFDGITFHEILCKSALNKVPHAAHLPFRFTVNGYRGCSHACVYCFARPTHDYLGLDTGRCFGPGQAVNEAVIIAFMLLFALNSILTAIYFQVVPQNGL